MRHVVRGMLVACAATTCTLSGSSAYQGRPQMQRLPQVENERVSAWKSVIPPGAESTLHRHDRARLVIAIVGGDLKTVTADGRTNVTHYETGRAYWQDPMPAMETHKDVNDTSRTIELVLVELKQ